MQSIELTKPITTESLLKEFESRFNQTMDLSKFTKEELEDMANKVRTKIHEITQNTHFGQELKDNNYQKSQMMLDIVNQAISEYSDMEKKAAAARAAEERAAAFVTPTRPAAGSRKRKKAKAKRMRKLKQQEESVRRLSQTKAASSSFERSESNETSGAEAGDWDTERPLERGAAGARAAERAQLRLVAARGRVHVVPVERYHRGRREGRAVGGGSDFW